MEFASGKRFTNSLSQQDTSECTDPTYSLVSLPFQIELDERILKNSYSAVDSTRNRSEVYGVSEEDGGNGLGLVELHRLESKCLRL